MVSVGGRWPGRSAPASSLDGAAPSLGKQGMVGSVVVSGAGGGRGWVGATRGGGGGGLQGKQGASSRSPMEVVSTPPRIRPCSLKVCVGLGLGLGFGSVGRAYFGGSGFLGSGLDVSWCFGVCVSFGFGCVMEKGVYVCARAL